MKKKTILLALSLSLLLMTGCTQENKAVDKDSTNDDVIILKDNLDLEINSEINLLSLLSENNKVQIVSEDEKIDTSALGKKELKLKYKTNDEEKEYTFEVNIIDTEAPTIEYKDTLTTNQGTKINLLKDVSAKDNSNESIEVKIEGEYDFNKVGEYKLKYVAMDSSGNKTEKDFTLKVNVKKTTSNNNSNSNTNSNKNNNTSTNNNNNNNNSAQKTCDLAEKQKYESEYNETKTKTEQNLEAYKKLKEENTNALNYVGGYISDGEYSIAYVNATTESEKITLNNRRKLSKNQDTIDQVINNLTSGLATLKQKYEQTLKEIGC